MRPSLRFLALVVVGWVGVRWAMIGTLPGLSLFETAPSEARAAPAVVATQFPAIAPVEPAPAMQDAAAPLGADGQLQPRPAAIPVYYYGVQSVRVPLGPGFARNAGGPVYIGRDVRIPLGPARAAPLTPLMPMPQRAIDPQYPPIDFSMSHLASLAWPQAASEVVTPGQSAPAIPGHKIDRIQLSMWAYLRSPQAMVAPSRSLATNGMLGGSQTGARLFYNFNSRLAAVARFSSDVGRRGGEAALGLRIHPLQSVPIWITAERRQAIGRYGNGRSAFALFAEGGVYDRPLGGGFLLDGYAQAGIVGARSRDLFADGGFTVTRPVYKKFSAGFGLWGAAQPGVYRVDVGPRVSMRVRKNVRVHFDYRQRVAGNARPDSGASVTLAGDF